MLWPPFKNSQMPTLVNPVPRRPASTLPPPRIHGPQQVPVPTHRVSPSPKPNFPSSKPHSPTLVAPSVFAYAIPPPVSKAPSTLPTL
ncbi:hypothetical protein BC829DRAFT_393557 [Chytridium lagenaria]|nr:hypothetical protein BC829DRAFT_393557 [Chytridium lagenaria]